MALPRSQSTMLAGVLVILVLSFLLFVQWLYYRGDEVTQEETIRGPNPDGSWGSYAEPMVQVKGIRIKYGEEDEAMIILEINIGQGRKYGATVTIPVYPLTKEAGLEVDQ